MRLTLAAVLLPIVLLSATVPPAVAQDAQRTATREKLSTLLLTAGLRNDVNVEFRQSPKNAWNFVGSMTTRLKNAESLEIVVSVSDANTIGFRVYPHYHGAYINLDRAKDAAGLMRRLLALSDHNFLYWGADDEGDVFSGYTITLESGFPEEGIIVVLRSIRNEDEYVGTLRPFIDGTAAQ